MTSEKTVSKETVHQISFHEIGFLFIGKSAMIAKKMLLALEWRLTTLKMTRLHCSSNLAKLVSTPPDKEKAQMKGLIVSGMLAGLYCLDISFKSY